MVALALCGVGFGADAHVLVLRWVFVLPQHEFGHAAAAAAHGERVVGVGVLLAAFLPGAYVRTGPELRDRSSWVQLSVYTAGVWHNMVRWWLRSVLRSCTCPALTRMRRTQVLCLACLAVLSHFGAVMAPAYATGLGATVTAVPDWSPFARHVNVGMVVTELEGVPISSGTEYLDAVAALHVCVPTRAFRSRGAWAVCGLTLMVHRVRVRSLMQRRQR